MSATKLQQLARKCDLALKPLDAWPGKRTMPRPSQFKADWTDTCRLLASELDALNAKDGVLQVEAPAEQFRLDGQPRAGIKLGRGVVLSFTTKAGALMFPCDTFEGGWQMGAWESNVRAIALGLQALRAVDRYGISPRHEQYRGWAALPAATPEGFETSWEAAAFLSKHSGHGVWPIHDAVNIGQDAYRIAAKRLHPDAGGDTREFQRLQQAMAVLRKHWGAGA
jgi:hypothetical protein